MKIKEFSAKFGVSARTIRFYEEKGLLSPSEREDNQYRVFSENEVWRLQTILSLREIGLSVEAVKKALEHIDQGNQDELLYYLQLQRAAMFAQMVELRQNIQTADRMIDMLKRSERLAVDDIYQLAEGAKRFREIRKNCEDCWNFDQQAMYYDERIRNPQTLAAAHPNYEEALALTVEWVMPQNGENGLEVGIGTGNLAGKFLAGGIAVCGIDGSKEMLKQCKKKFPQLETKLGQFLALPYLDKEFDFVVSSFAFHYLTENQKYLALKEMQRVLKLGGRICITDFMFADFAAKEAYHNELDSNSHLTAAKKLELEQYADRSKMQLWFEEHGFTVQCRQYNELLHIVLAVSSCQ